MIISNRKAVFIHYAVKTTDGELIDSSDNEEPLGYLHGMGNIIPGLENALEGRKAGEKVTVVVTPEEGYGHIQETLIREFPLDQFDEPEKVQPGVQFHFDSPNGPAPAIVTKVEGDTVTVDLNHPLAGETLHFEVEVVNVRDAEQEELDHGHIHGEGGHHH